MTQKIKPGGAVPGGYKLQQRLGFRLSRLSRLMQSRLEADLADYGLTRLRWCVLSSVEIEGHHAPSELAEHIGITRPAMSRLLKEMIREGLVERALDDADGRSRQISVTEAGRAKLHASWPKVDANQTHFMSKLSITQQAALYDALDSLMMGESKMLDDL